MTKIKEGRPAAVILDKFRLPDPRIAGDISSFDRVGGMSLLAAVHYQSGFPIDEFMAAVATALQRENIRLGGAVQGNIAKLPTSCSEMTLVDLATGNRFGISQDLGAEAQGCRLDASGLVELAGRLDVTIGHGLDLLILNKFGRAEAEGGGLRDVIARAVDVGVSVLTAVRPPYSDAWERFHGGIAAELVPDPDVVLAWCRGVARRRQDALAGD